VRCEGDVSSYKKKHKGEIKLNLQQIKTKTIVVLLVLAIGTAGSLWFVNNGLSNYANAEASVPQKSDVKIIEPVSFPEDATTFFGKGGKSIISIDPEIPEIKHIYAIDGARGTTVTIPLMVKHQGGPNPLTEVTLVSKGISNDYVPASVNKMYPPDQRIKIFQDTGKMPAGVIDLNSTVTFSDNTITLKPGESKRIYMYIHIPANWPDELIHQLIWYSVEIDSSQVYQNHELEVIPASLALHVVN
jgi:hypothetical protein